MEKLIAGLCGCCDRSKHTTANSGAAPMSAGSAMYSGAATLRRIRWDTPVHTDTVMCVVHVSTGVCLSGSKDQSLVLYDHANIKVKQKWCGHSKEITKVAYGSNIKSFFSASRDKTINMWHVDSPDPVLQFKGHELVINGLALNSDNNQMCSGSRDNSLRLWNVKTGQCVSENNVTRNLVTHIRWAEDTDVIAQTGEDKIVRIWDARTLSVVHMFPPKRHIQNWCDISDSKSYCVTCSRGVNGNGCEATLWDLRTNNIVHEFKGHTEGIGSCIFIPWTDGRSLNLLATCSDDCSVRIWDRDTAECLASVGIPGSGPLTSITACDSNKLCVSSFNTGIHILQMTFSQEGVIGLHEIIHY